MSKNLVCDYIMRVCRGHPDGACRHAAVVRVREGLLRKSRHLLQKVCREEKYPTTVRKPYMRHEMRPFKTTVMVPQEVIVKRPGRF